MKAELLLADFDAALARLEDALKLDTESDVYKAGCIQYFEFTFELACRIPTTQKMRSRSMKSSKTLFRRFMR